jgi:hypothetical protein
MHNDVGKYAHSIIIHEAIQLITSLIVEHCWAALDSRLAVAISPLPAAKAFFPALCLVGPLPFAATSFALWLLSTSFCVRRTPRLGRRASAVSTVSPVSLSLSLLLSEEEEEEVEAHSRMEMEELRAAVVGYGAP